MKLNYLNPNQAEVIHAWWKALQPQESNAAPAGESQAKQGKGKEGEGKEAETSGRNPKPFWFDRGHRARLRRASSLEDLKLESSCFELRDRLGELKSPWLSENDEVWLFLVCGAVALVRNDTQANRGLALALGNSSLRDGAMSMSELRFRRLMKEEDPEKFFLQLRRALQLAEGAVNVAMLADDLIAWWQEQTLSRPSAHDVGYRWAKDYYLTPKDKKAEQANAAEQGAAEGTAAAK